MPEVYRKKNGHSHRFAAQLGGHEPKVGRAGDRRGVECLESARLGDARGLRDGPAIRIDEDAQRDVALRFPRIERHRIVEWWIERVDHRGRLIRLLRSWRVAR